MKYIFIENPAAGRSSAHATYAEISASLKNNPDCEFIKTDYPGHATELARRVSKEYGSDALIFVCGGDGTLSEVATGLEGSGSPIALLPMGSGNDFARKIYGDMTLEEIARGFGLFDGTPSFKTAQTDYIKVNGSRCVNVMSLGLDTTILSLANKLTERFSFLGGFAYKLAILASLFKSKKYSARFELEAINGDGISAEREFTLAAICNASYYGGGFCPARDSLIDDGILDFIIARKLSLIQIAGMIGHYFKGDVHISHPHLVDTARLVRGKITSLSSEPLIYNCDGNIRSADSIEFEIIKGGLNLAYFENSAILKAIDKRTKSRL